MKEDKWIFFLLNSNYCISIFIQGLINNMLHIRILSFEYKMNALFFKRLQENLVIMVALLNYYCQMIISISVNHLSKSSTSEKYPFSAFVAVELCKSFSFLSYIFFFTRIKDMSLIRFLFTFLFAQLVTSCNTCVLYKSTKTKIPLNCE